MTARDNTSATRSIRKGGHEKISLATDLGTVDKQGQVLTADAGARAVTELYLNALQQCGRYGVSMRLRL